MAALDCGPFDVELHREPTITTSLWRAPLSGRLHS
jgi:hypothetical protein